MWVLRFDKKAREEEGDQDAKPIEGVNKDRNRSSSLCCRSRRRLIPRYVLCNDDDDDDDDRHVGIINKSNSSFFVKTCERASRYVYTLSHTQNQVKASTSSSP